MNENYFACSCGFKCVEGQLAKSDGACPKCGKRTVAMKEKYDSSKSEQTNIHKQLRGEM
jgi:hypothetical protein